MTTLARKGQKIFMTALSTSDPGEAVSQNSAVQVAVDDRPKIGTVKPIGLFKPLLIHPFMGPCPRTRGRRVRARWTSILDDDCVTAQAIRRVDGKAARRHAARAPGGMIRRLGPNGVIADVAFHAGRYAIGVSLASRGRKVQRNRVVVAQPVGQPRVLMDGAEQRLRVALAEDLDIAGGLIVPGGIKAHGELPLLAIRGRHEDAPVAASAGGEKKVAFGVVRGRLELAKVRPPIGDAADYRRQSGWKRQERRSNGAASYE